MCSWVYCAYGVGNIQKLRVYVFCLASFGFKGFWAQTVCYQPKVFDIVVGMSGSSTVFAGLEGLADEWENAKMLRTRIQTLGCLVVESPLEGQKEVYLDKIVARTMANARYNSDVLYPVFEKMSGEHDKVPELPALCSELRKFFHTHQKVPTKSELQDQAWSIRYLFGTVKHLLYRPTPPRVSWQCLL